MGTKATALANTVLNLIFNRSGSLGSLAGPSDDDALLSGRATPDEDAGASSNSEISEVILGTTSRRSGLSIGTTTTTPVRKGHTLCLQPMSSTRSKDKSKPACRIVDTPAVDSLLASSTSDTAGTAASTDEDVPTLDEPTQDEPPSRRRSDLPDNSDNDSDSLQPFDKYATFSPVEYSSHHDKQVASPDYFAKESE